MFRAVVCLLFASGVLSDVYLHVPRGSNNRLREQSAARTNANRLFDSQNNNRGGYNVGDKTKQGSGNNAENQYSMKYFMSGPKYKTLTSGQGQTKLTIEWTNQHGCGGNEDSDPHKQNCDIVLQYMCQDDVTAAAGMFITKLLHGCRFNFLMGSLIMKN
ncbi:hypothetical protein CAPTEDRAFT_159196 [Capitella teleta]|uniref:WxxW domain-containing protein n=1 Tax=Capitella teleta TaxID=283909 RepID=R7TQM5_CAPTE|nr:hypothetical protein CAPTEDRAFT_159196 [Capitella teleta]|eukprot:ELT93315.1 hypothetical protein CAPTEDRAFT_159196 [Capitella teleta]